MTPGERDAACTGRRERAAFLAIWERTWHKAMEREIVKVRKA